MGNSSGPVRYAPLKKTKRRVLPLTIYEFRCGGTLLQQTLRAVRSLDWVSNQYNSRSIKQLNSLPVFRELHQWFGRCLDATRCDLGLPFQRLVITQSWANKTEPGESHHAHVHQNSYMSGIFYLTSSKTGGTEFCCQDPWFDFFLLEEPDSVKTVTFKQYPTAGKLLLFPSSLEHSVAEHRSEAPRFTISFNSFPQGRIGDAPDGLRLLNLKVVSSDRQRSRQRA